MPCDTIQTVGVKLGKADLALLTAALADLKLSPRRQGSIIYFGQGESFNHDTGELRIVGTRNVAEIKRAYSAQVVKSQAKRYGWQLKETAPFQYEVMKR